MSYKLSVKDLKRPDKILSILRNFVKLINLNIKNLIMFSGIIILIVAVLVFYNYNIEKKEAHASFKLYQVKKDFKEDTSNVEKIAKLKTLLNDLSATKAKNLAKFELAKLYFEEKNYDEAIIYFQELSKKKITYISNAATFLTALSFQNKNECDKAINFYNTFIKKEDLLYTEKAMFNIAVCSYLLNDIPKAIEMYDTINIKYPNSNYAKLANIAKNKIKEGVN